MDIANLKLAANRLASIDQQECREALVLVMKAIDNQNLFESSAKAELALCHALWDCISRALDHGDFTIDEEACLDALQAEMAGRTYCARQALGWVVRSRTAPAEEPSLRDLSVMRSFTQMLQKTNTTGSAEAAVSRKIRCPICALHLLHQRSIYPCLGQKLLLDGTEKSPIPLTCVARAASGSEVGCVAVPRGINVVGLGRWPTAVSTPVPMNLKNGAGHAWLNVHTPLTLEVARQTPLARP
jgi:hypothetical protein